MLSCLYTSIRNISGEERYFGVLPPHGKRLAAGEEVTIFGDLTTRVAGKPRLEKAYEAALGSRDELAILYTPEVHLYDETDERTRALALDGGTLGTVDPCWGSFSSSSGEPIPA